MAFLRRLELHLLEQVAAEGGYGDRGDDSDPGGEEDRAGVEEKGIGCDESPPGGA